jgi:hypothetical protein
MEGSSLGGLWCLEALQGATTQEPYLQGVGEAPDSWEQHLSPCSSSSENIEGLTEKVGTLGLWPARKNRCGAAKKLARWAKMAEALARHSTGVQSRPPQGSQKQALQVPDTSGTQGKGKEMVKSGPGQGGPASLEAKGPSQGPSTCQRSSGGTPGGGQAGKEAQDYWATKPCHSLSGGGVQAAIVCEVYLEVQVSKENFVNIQRAVGGLPLEGFTPRLIDMYWTKGASAVVCQDEETRDWLAGNLPTLRAWEDSRLKMVRLDVLPTHKSGGLVPGPCGGY